MIEIVRATPADARGVAVVGESVRYRPETADGSRGYLVHVATPEEYRRRLAVSQYSVVAQEGGQVVAFLLVSTGEELAGANGHTCTDDETARVALQSGSSGLLLVDQIGVSPSVRGQGLAQRMFDAVVATVRPQRMVAAIMHCPVRNERSIGFFAGKNGFRCVEESPEPPYVWGVYEWRR